MTKLPNMALVGTRGIGRPQYRLRVEEVRVFYDVSGSTVEVLAIAPKSEGRVMASPVRKSKMKEVPLSEVKDDLSRFLRQAETQDVVITRHGKPAGVLIGFRSEDDWFDYRLENDPRFLQSRLGKHSSSPRRQARRHQVTVRSNKRNRRRHPFSVATRAEQCASLRTLECMKGQVPKRRTAR